MSRVTRVSDGRARGFRVRDYHALWCRFPATSANLSFGNSHVSDPTTPTEPQSGWFRLFRVRSPLLTESHVVFFSSGY